MGLKKDYHLVKTMKNFNTMLKFTKSLALFFSISVSTSILSFVGINSVWAVNEKGAQSVVNVYGWHEQIPQSLLDKFTAETGIRVIYDVIDTNEVLEAKLLAGNTGYDVVFPTTWPYVKRQAASGLYAPLDREKLPNHNKIGPDFLARMEKADPGNTFAVPYTWGLVALGYNPDLIPDDVSPEDLNSWGLIYDPNIVSKIAKRGIAMLEDPLDVFTSFSIYKGENLQDMSLTLLKEMTAELKALRPNYRRFGTNLSAEQLGNGELAIVMHWSGILATARNKFKKLNPQSKMEVVLPKEGTVMWIDCIAIPKDAPNIDNAHKFIDFLLRPENAAVVTNKVYTATTISGAVEFLEKDIKNNKTVFPDKAYMKKVIMPEITSLQYQRRMARAFASIITHKAR